jgi:hypothetical protein
MADGEDKIALALTLLDAEAPAKNILIQGDPGDPRRRTYTVPTLDRRRQVVNAMAVPDSLFHERLELVSISVRELPVDAGLLVGLLAIAKEFRHVRLCVFEPNRPQLAVVSSIVPYEIHNHSGPRLLHALREVAAVADSLENQITGADEE